MIPNGAGGSGAPVEVSWSGPQPCGPQCDAAKPSAGFSLLPNVSHHTVYSAAPRLGTYNHGPVPYWWSGTFWLAWHNAPHQEAHHMRVITATSVTTAASEHGADQVERRTRAWAKERF